MISIFGAIKKVSSLAVIGKVFACSTPPASAHRASPARRGKGVLLALGLGLALSAALAFPSQAVAADLYIYGGSGGGGGRSDNGGGGGGGAGGSDPSGFIGGGGAGGNSSYGGGAGGGTGGGLDSSDATQNTGGGGGGGYTSTVPGSGLGGGADGGSWNGAAPGSQGSGGGAGDPINAIGGKGGDGIAAGGGGGGGGSGKSGSGGAGGAGTLYTYPTALSGSYGILAIRGGIGGDGGANGGSVTNDAGGGGGGGGSVSAAVNGPLSATSLTVSGGNGGSAAINIFSSPADSGGDAGLGGAGGIQGQNGSGGGGGDATLNATGQTVTVTGALTVSSGAAGGAQANGYGAGGDATFIAGTLIAPTMTLTKNDGAISVAVDTLNVNQNTTITVEGTAAADVVIDTVNVAAGQTLTIASLNSGELTINHLNIAPQPQPPAPPVPPPIPTPDPAFSDGDTLSPGNRYTAPAGNSSFCLGGNPGSAPVTIRIDNVPYTITPEAENTCFEIFSAGSGRALILDSGTAEIGTIVPGAALLEARNGDLVVDDSHTGSTSATIRAMLDPVCTSTRITVLEGTVSAPDWIKSPMPASGCPADALTPGKGNFMVSNGKLACPPSSLEIKGNWAKLTVKHTQNLNAGQQVFDVATYGGAWFQNAPHGWAALGESFEPVDSATESGQRTTTLVNGLDVRGIPGTELYTGHGANADEMMMNGRYCGVFRVAP